MGNSGTPTGTVTFRDNGNAIAGCTSVALSNGKASCTTSSLAGGAHPVTGLYSGDAIYSTGIAGPITQTVVGAPAPMKLSIDSSKYTTSYGQNVVFTVKVTGGVSPNGTVTFQDNGVAIAGCSSVALSSGAAKCNTKALSRGTHQVRGYYANDPVNGAGIAGPITQTVQ